MIRDISSKFHILSMCPCVVATVHPNSAACQPLFAPGAIHLSQTGIVSAPGHTAPGEKSLENHGISQEIWRYHKTSPLGRRHLNGIVVILAAQQRWCQEFQGFLLASLEDWDF